MRTPIPRNSPETKASKIAFLLTFISIPLLAASLNARATIDLDEQAPALPQADQELSVTLLPSADQARVLEDLSDGQLDVPEPMAFDLVRPLGAKQGELEVNVLGVFTPRGRQLRYELAPEIEYALFDGHAVEFELPTVDGRFADLKLAIQGTLGRPGGPGSQMIHGWQVIGLYELQDRHIEITGLYLLGYQLNRRVSGMLMAGGRMNSGGGEALLFNPTFFYRISKSVNAGWENNLEFPLGGAAGFLYRGLPQAGIHLSDRLELQVGAGWQRDDWGSSLLAAIRTILVF